MAVFLAYDGSVNGDWIARYAVRMAAHTPERVLTVLYGEDVGLPAPALADRFEALTAQAAAQGVRAEVEVIPVHGGVFRGLVERLPPGPGTVLVCGLRVRGGRRGYLAGTISAQLLAHGRFHTLALRVVRPGLLGVARRVLAPVGDHPRQPGQGLTCLGLLGADIRRVHVLRVVTLGSVAFRRLDARRAGRLRAAGSERTQAVAAEVAAALRLDPAHVHPLVRVSDDWVKQVVIEAGRLDSDLIYLEAPRASLARLFRFGDPMEELLRDTPCDVALYRGPA
ncbi:MAG: hypothetical protein H6907_17215 [Hyphomicrobiales bacterium]|nr:hypothetical protein [Hyphomicrobiales bacterium]